jgi:hypothetical protein
VTAERQIVVWFMGIGQTMRRCGATVRSLLSRTDLTTLVLIDPSMAEMGETGECMRRQGSRMYSSAEWATASMAASNIHDRYQSLRRILDPGIRSETHGLRRSKTSDVDVQFMLHKRVGMTHSFSSLHLKAITSRRHVCPLSSMLL